MHRRDIEAIARHLKARMDYIGTKNNGALTDEQAEMARVTCVAVIHDIGNAIEEINPSIDAGRFKRSCGLTY